MKSADIVESVVDLGENSGSCLYVAGQRLKNADGIGTLIPWLRASL